MYKKSLSLDLISRFKKLDIILFNIRFNIIILKFSLVSFLSPNFVDQNSVRISCLPHTWHMPRPSHPCYTTMNSEKCLLSIHFFFPFANCHDIAFRIKGFVLLLVALLLLCPLCWLIEAARMWSVVKFWALIFLSVSYAKLGGSFYGCVRGGMRFAL